MSSLRLLPVSCTFSALTTTTLSPQSMCGVKEGLCLPRSLVAMIAASRPSTRPSASITTHFLSISDGLAEKVFIVHSSAAGRYSCPVRESRSCKGSANGGQAPLLAGGCGITSSRSRQRRDKDDGHAEDDRECSGSPRGMRSGRSAPHHEPTGSAQRAFGDADVGAARCSRPRGKGVAG